MKLESEQHKTRNETRVGTRNAISGTATKNETNIAFINGKMNL